MLGEIQGKSLSACKPSFKVSILTVDFDDQHTFSKSGYGEYTVSLTAEHTSESPTLLPYPSTAV